MSTYIHGYLPEEQKRLLEQAGILSPLIYPRIDFTGCRSLLEIGCGVGAQTKTLLQLFPNLSITCVDYSEEQLEKARQNLSSFSNRNLNFIHQDARKLELNRHFDSAFICWALEHIPQAEQVLRSLKKHLVSGSKIWITEVFNSSFYVYPATPGLDHYYRGYNEYQRILGGDPDIGAKLGTLLHEAGFKEINLYRGGFHLDRRNPEQLRKFTRYWKSLMKSASAGMLELGIIIERDIESMEKDLDDLPNHPDVVFFYQFIQASATC